MRFLRTLIQRWNNWVGDRSLELAIQAQLEAEGLPRRASRIVDCRLVAIERPGWISIHQFEIQIDEPTGNSRCYFGVTKDDGRRNPVVRIFEKANLRDQQRDAWSCGMIVAPHLRR